LSGSAVACHGLIIREFRKSAGWTQKQLAERAGYSERLIRKAEKGGQLRDTSLAAIALAFQQAGLKVSFADLRTDAVAVVQTFIEAYQTREIEMLDRIRHVLSEDLEVFVAGDPATIPFAGNYNGPEGFQKFWNRFLASVECGHRMALVDVQYFVRGQDIVAHCVEKDRQTGHTPDGRSWLSLKFRVRGGQIVRFEDYFDTASTQAHIQAFRQKMGVATIQAEAS
jgi:transcriptional regulator with XRE-family HTH domain